MQLATVWLQPGLRARCHDIDPPTATDLLWLATRLINKVEHISARTEPPGLAAGLFFADVRPDAASGIVARICREALESSPLFHGWEIRVATSTPMGMLK
jgi:hypothetical protein